MSEPKRYDLAINRDEDRIGILLVENGDYVRYEDYARLKAEVERLEESHSTDFVRAEMYRHLLDENAKLKEEVMRIRNNDCKECDILQKCCEHQKNRIACLKAEVERLTKAGDEMAKDLRGEFGDYPSADAWHAAKEGKQP